MIIVQVLMVAAAVVMFFLGIRSRGAQSVDAWKKLFFGLLMLVVVLAILSPSGVGRVAQLVGVGRGTDLVLYVVSLAFGFFVVNQYLRAQEARNQLHKLARRIAIVEAVERYGLDRERALDISPTALVKAESADPATRDATRDASAT